MSSPFQMWRDTKPKSMSRKKAVSAWVSLPDDTKNDWKKKCQEAHSYTSDANFLPNQIYNAEELEKKSNLGLLFLSDEVGSGKTVSFLLWIYNRKQSNKPFRTMVIVSFNIVHQWEEDIQKFFPASLSYWSISKKQDRIADNNTDIIICTPNSFVSCELSTLDIDVICYDEFTTLSRKNFSHHIDIPTVIISSNRFFDGSENVDNELLWCIQAMYLKSSQYGIEYGNQRIWRDDAFIRLILNQTRVNFSRVDLSTLYCTIKSNITCLETFNVKKQSYYYNPSKTVKMLSGIVSENVITLIKEYDFKSATSELIGYMKREYSLDINPSNISENIIDLVKMLKIKEIKSLDERKQKAIKEETPVDSIIKKHKEKLRDFELFNERYKDLCEGDCDICCMELKTPALFGCCNNIVCTECSKKLSTCPFCRSVVESFSMDKYKSISKTMAFIVTDILKQSNSTLIFRLGRHCDVEYDNIFGDGVLLRGQVKTRERIIKQYHSGEIRTLILNLGTDCSGLRLENTTDIIFLCSPEYVAGDVENQIIGRALRMGRESNLDLKIHYVMANE